VILHDDVEGAEFGDRRLSDRLVEIVDRLAPSPEASFPTAMSGDAELEATYRFLSNPSVTPARILAPHIAATVGRAVATKTILVAHDTTEIRYSTDREGLGRLSDQGHGFFAHFALAMSADGQRRPLGVLGLETLVRQGPVPKAKKTGRRRDSGEGRRWADLIASVRAQLGNAVQAIHLMDREADSYPLFAKLIADGERFISRMRHDRVVLAPQPASYWLSDKLELAEDLFLRDRVRLAPRQRESVEKDRSSHPPRKARTVQLAVSAVKVTLRRPPYLRRERGPDAITVHVVHVRETDPPPGVAPVDWKLATTEPIDTIDQVGAIVDAYRARWVIEEFFKALKTGCGIEKRQLESRHSLLDALAIFTPIAWQLLSLRHFARHAPQNPAPSVLSNFRLRLMRAHPKIQLASKATVREAMLAIARLGGHIKNNGDPGWMVLGRGLDKLLLLEEGARIALGM